jgi:hypothetical protein
MVSPRHRPSMVNEYSVRPMAVHRELSNNFFSCALRYQILHAKLKRWYILKLQICISSNIKLTSIFFTNIYLKLSLHESTIIKYVNNKYSMLQANALQRINNLYLLGKYSIPLNKTHLFRNCINNLFKYETVWTLRDLAVGILYNEYCRFSAHTAKLAGSAWLSTRKRSSDRCR